MDHVATLFFKISNTDTMRAEAVDVFMSRGVKPMLGILKNIRTINIGKITKFKQRRRTLENKDSEMRSNIDLHNVSNNQLNYKSRPHMLITSLQQTVCNKTSKTHIGFKIALLFAAVKEMLLLRSNNALGVDQDAAQVAD